MKYSPHVATDGKQFVPFPNSNQRSPTNDRQSSKKAGGSYSTNMNTFKASHLEERFAHSRKMLDDLRLGKYTVADPLKINEEAELYNVSESQNEMDLHELKKKFERD